MEDFELIELKDDKMRAQALIEADEAKAIKEEHDGCDE